jgi:hypothetical protein
LHKKIWWGNPREEECLEGLSEDGKLILKWIFKKWDVGMDWINLAHDRDRWRALVNAAIHIWFR